MKNENQIPGGYTIWARQTIDNELFYSKPAMWFKIWFYLVNRAAHTTTKKYEKGEVFIQYEWITEKTGATLDQIKKCVAYLKKNAMLSTARSTRGVWLKITNYSKYQDGNSYCFDLKAPHEALEKHQRSTREALRYNKNDKNDKNISKEIEETSDPEPVYVEEFPKKKKKTQRMDITNSYNFLKEQLNGTPDGTQAENRKYAMLLLNKLKKDYPNFNSEEQVRFLITSGMADKFHSKNLTNFKYLYYNCQKIIQSVKGSTNTVNV